MAESLDTNTKELLSQYLAEVRSLPDESAKTHRFVVLVGAGIPWIGGDQQLRAGIEKAIRIQLPERAKQGRIDSISETQSSNLNTRSRRPARSRSSSYGIAVPAFGRKRENITDRCLPLLATASLWRTYRTSLPTNLEESPKSGDTILDLLRELTLTDSNLFDFYLFLNTLLFRTG